MQFTNWTEIKSHFSHTALTINHLGVSSTEMWKQKGVKQIAMGS